MDSNKVVVEVCGGYIRIDCNTSGLADGVYEYFAAPAKELSATGAEQPQPAKCPHWIDTGHCMWAKHVACSIFGPCDNVRIQRAVRISWG